MNVGTIVEAPVMWVKLGRGRKLGEIEEYFVDGLTPGDTFIFAGRLLRFEGIRDNDVMVTPGQERQGPEGAGLCRRPAAADDHAGRPGARHPGRPGDAGASLPAAGARMAGAAGAGARALPAPDELLVETFARRGRHFLVAYCFAGRNAHQTLGMLLTRRMERLKLRPLGFSASDYCLAVWGLEPVRDIAALFDVDMLGDDLEEWMAESSMLKRTFRNCAVIAGLIERRHPGQEKTGRQVTFSADLIYDVLRKYEPDHVLLRAAREEAATGLTDIRRLADLLVSVQGRIRHRELERISPFAVGIIADIGRERVMGESADVALEELTAELVAEALAD